MAKINEIQFSNRKREVFFKKKLPSHFFSRGGEYLNCDLPVELAGWRRELLLCRMRWEGVEGFFNGI